MFAWLKAASARSQQVGQSGRAHREEGNRLLALDRIGEAAACYARAVAADPHDPLALVNLGFAQGELGRHGEAVMHLQQAVALDPRNHDALFLLAGAREQVADIPGAIESLGNALQIQPLFEPARASLCRLLFQTGQFDQATAVIDEGISGNPAVADFHLYRGHLWMQAGRPESAAASYRRALALDPGNAGLHRVLGATLLQLGDAAGAVASLQEALRVSPAGAQDLSDLGHALRLQGRPDEAVAFCERALTLDPSLAAAHNNLGASLIELDQPGRALASFESATRHAPDFAGAWTNRGAVLTALDRPAEAMTCHEKALALDAQSAEAWNNLGNTLLALHRADEALAAFDRALGIEPRHARALNHRGNALRKLGRHEQALASYDSALAISPANPQALNNRANVLADLGRLGQADAAYAQALAISGDYAEALFNRANAQRNAGRLQEALSNYGRALALKPDMPFLFGNWLHAKQHACEWDGLAGNFEELARRIQTPGQVVNPFITVASPLPPAVQRRAVECYVQNQFPQREPALAPSTAPGSRGGRIRIGYFSADFHEHATSYLMAELFEQHDRSRFELFAFSFGPERTDSMRARLVSAFDHFLVVNNQSDHEVAARARALEVDIAVDLKGFTQNSRPGIFAERPAPVRVNYLGFPGTMGTGLVDYLIADSIVVPPSHQDFFAEKLAYLPGCYQVNDSQRAIDASPVHRSDLGLPDSGFVFCCFNNNYKITPAIFDVWMRLLQHVEGSVLWLLESNPLAKGNLRAQAEARGISGSRLVFAGHAKLPQHLARHRAADLFLDTIYCNAHTTASDALWAGLPVLTCPGETFASRVAASLLHALDLPELVAGSLVDYEATALALAHDCEALSALKARLGKARLSTGVFDAKRFARHLESAFTKMHSRRHDGLPPEAFVIA